MKRIEFIAPVDSMRGNLGSKQRLLYRPNNNRAFESISGELNTALNYENRFIAAKTKTNVRYFSVKTKTSNFLSNKAKDAMALLGGAGAIYAAIIKDTSNAIYLNAKAVYDEYVAAGYQGSMRKFYFDHLLEGLKNKVEYWNLARGSHQVIIDNPWVKKREINVNVSRSIIIKFWLELAVNPIVYYVGNQKGIAHEGDYFVDIIGSEAMNILNLSRDTVTIDETEYPYCIFIANDEDVNVKALAIGNVPIIDSDLVQPIKYDLLDGTIEAG